jgi:hypothetical protein
MQTVTIGKYYYAVTPRSEPRKVSERVQVLAIDGELIKVKTAESLRCEDVYTLTIDKFRFV